MKVWLPDHSEPGPSPLSEQAPRSQTPPLISFLESFPDVLTADEARGKRFPCGHVVSVGSILACCNLFGDAPWTPGSQSWGCAQPDCSDTLPFPKIPDPRVVDGLQARLDLVQWSWNKDPPTKLDLNKVSLLRDMLCRMGHLSQDPEPEMDDDVALGDPSEPSLMRTLVHMELEAFDLMVLYQSKRAEIALRGDQQYCRYREAVLPKATAGRSLLRYPMLSPGQDCECVTPHEYEREASSWALTPAETESDPDKPKDENSKKLKTVRFVSSVVTEVQYFEPWWCDEYRDSGRYWSTGPFVRSVDLSTQADDEWEIERLEHPEGLAADISRELEGEESDESTLVNADEVLDEMERVDESWDDEVLDEMERANESFDDEVMEDLKELHESWEDWF